MMARQAKATEERGYGVGIAAQVSGIKLRTLQRWADQGFIVPSVQQGKGKGSWDLFSFADLVALRAARRLREQGLSLQALKKAVVALRQLDTSASLAKYALVSDGREVWTQTNGQPIALLRQPGQIGFSWAMDLSLIEKEVRRALRKAA
jgi:DNA-binding transcriptional MerR regulator